MSGNTSFSNDSILNPPVSFMGFSTYLKCFIIPPSSYLCTALSIIKIILILPLSIFVLYLGFQKWQLKRSSSSAAAITHSDCFTYHVAAINCLGVFGNMLSVCDMRLYPSNESVDLVDSSYFFYDKCVFSGAPLYLYSSLAVINVVVLLPLCIYIIIYGVRKWRPKHSSAATMSHSDCFLYHMVVMETIGVFSCDPVGFWCVFQAVSIVGEEVFSFNLSLTPNATDGAAYIDTSKTDGEVMLNLGCIQVVYLHKFFMSLLNFTNNFQAAKDTLSNATAQAAEKAASSVRDFAQKSFRLSMDIRLKAPLIIIPQSSTSHNALVIDLGLITVTNSYRLLSIEGCPLPAVIDIMDVQLGDLKLSRSCVESDSSAAIELLEPVNLHLDIQRNLSAFWYKKMAAVEIHGNLKPSKMDLSQDDLTMLLRIVTENLGEVAASLPSGSRQDNSQLLQVPKSSLTEESEKPNDCSEEEEALGTVKFSLSIESLGLILYSNDPEQPLEQQHQQERRLGELTLHLLRVSGNIQSNRNLEVSIILTNCTLDDLRAGMERVTTRMVRRRQEDSSEPMIDVTYRQAPAEKELVLILQKLYLCASVEFLMAVTDSSFKLCPKRLIRLTQ
ncbi:Vacuolar protein sorting-associated protein 13C [Oryzias melastigma]|uniref:Vacuolar protein sorting-associated protein 13C n=1 Tax=Oryzias melastigma TaxID=30732 RepID=A0A834EVK1_ORYME|nr:Vacuolar protein sorting-associated protein 13C [Oryzias melastigma]